MPLIRIDDRADGLEVVWRVDAPRDRVWRCLTEPELLGRWLGELVSGAVAAGSDFVVDHGGGYRCTSRVTTWAEPTRVAFSWEFPDEARSDVDLELTESDDGAELRLAHTGLGELVASYRIGWCVHLTYLEAAAIGEPLPSAMFWRLHATMAHLAG